MDFTIQVFNGLSQSEKDFIEKMFIQEASRSIALVEFYRMQKKSSKAITAEKKMLAIVKLANKLYGNKWNKYMKI